MCSENKVKCSEKQKTYMAEVKATFLAEYFSNLDLYHQFLLRKNNPNLIISSEDEERYLKMTPTQQNYYLFYVEHKAYLLNLLKSSKVK